jgi:hypothetical protein
MAIESFLLCIDCAVPSEEQKRRINALLFLVELHPGGENQELKEKYFYQAVELVRHYF